MNAIKERILGAVTMMNDTDAIKVWNFVVENLSPRSWNDIEEVQPDEWDLKMLDDIDKNPDCHEFITQEDLIKELNLEMIEADETMTNSPEMKKSGS